MSKQLHKNFIDEQVKLLLKSYVDKEIKINYILSILGIKRRRFFELLARWTAPLHERIQLRLVPDKESGLTEIRFWHEDDLLGIQKVKNSDLNLVQF